MAALGASLARAVRSVAASRGLCNVVQRSAPRSSLLNRAPAPLAFVQGVRPLSSALPSVWPLSSSSSSTTFGWARAAAAASLFSGVVAGCDRADDIVEAAESIVDAAEKAVAKKRDSRFDSLGPIVTNPEIRSKLDAYSVEVGHKLNDLLSTGVPQQITAGFSAGFAMGYAAKKSAKLLTVVLGVIVFTVQALAFAGYVKTDWDNLSEDFENWLDANGDGKVDSEDMKMWWKRFSAVAGYNLPAGSGWLGGLIMGFRAG